MPIDLVIDEREGGTKMEGLPGETNSNPDLRITLNIIQQLKLNFFTKVASEEYTYNPVSTGKPSYHQPEYYPSAPQHFVMEEYRYRYSGRLLNCLIFLSLKIPKPFILTMTIGIQPCSITISMVCQSWTILLEVLVDCFENSC